jgi:hypothetical protein
LVVQRHGGRKRQSGALNAYQCGNALLLAMRSVTTETSCFPVCLLALGTVATL